MWFRKLPTSVTSINANADPVVAWHTGGPGGSSVYGHYTELRYF